MTRYLHGLKMSPCMLLLNYKGEGRNFTREKDGMHHFNQMIKVKLYYGATQLHVPPDSRTQNYFCTIPAKIVMTWISPQGNMKLKLKDSLESNWPVFFKTINAMKYNESLRNCSSLKDVTTNCKTIYFLLPTIIPLMHYTVRFTVLSTFSRLFQVTMPLNMLTHSTTSPSLPSHPSRQSSVLLLAWNFLSPSTLPSLLHQKVIFPSSVSFLIVHSSSSFTLSFS